MEHPVLTTMLTTCSVRKHVQTAFALYLRLCEENSLPDVKWHCLVTESLNIIYIESNNTSETVINDHDEEDNEIHNSVVDLYIPVSRYDKLTPHWLNCVSETLKDTWDNSRIILSLCQGDQSFIFYETCPSIMLPIDVPIKQNQRKHNKRKHSQFIHDHIDQYEEYSEHFNDDKHNQTQLADNVQELSEVTTVNVLSDKTTEHGTDQLKLPQNEVPNNMKEIKDLTSSEDINILNEDVRDGDQPVLDTDKSKKTVTDASDIITIDMDQEESSAIDTDETISNTTKCTPGSPEIIDID